MNWQHAPYVVILIIAASVAMLVAIYAWQRRAVRGGIFFALLMVAVAQWAFSGAAEFAATDISTKIGWSKVSYLGIVSIAPLWLLFTGGYSQRTQPLAGRRAIWLWLVPVTILGLAVTNEWHRLIWPTITPVASVPGAMLVYGHGIGVWVNVVYSYSLLLLGTVWLVQATLRSPRLYRRQAGSLLAGAAIPWVANALYVAGQLPLPGLDPTPIAFTLTGLMMVWGLFRFHMLDIVPVAHDILVENLADSVLVLDARNRVVYINPAARQLVKCDAASAVGQPVETVLEEWPDLAARCQDTLAAQAEIEVDRAQARQWLELRVSPLYDQRGWLTGRLIVLRDITARKQNEEALQQYARELEAGNAELDAFAHTVAHDLKNPISVIVGYSTLLETHLETTSLAEVAAMLRRITQTGYKATSIIDALLLLASVHRMEDVDAEPFDMAVVVAEALSRLRALITEREAEIASPEHWPLAVGYAPWVEEVWVNYLSNALKYGVRPPAAPRLEMGYSILDPLPQESPLRIPYPASHMIRFWVKDHGPGLTPAQQAQLFTPFTRLSPSLGEGYGLGLSIVQRIVEKLGGQAGVESQEREGSTFWFTLPGVST
jgi:PAS domain S-box-containing protein